MDAIGWQLAKRAIGRPRIIRLPSGTFFKAYPDCVVSSALIYADWPEFHELMFIRKRLKPDQVAIDVGANVGHMLLLISDIISPERLVAFEPTPVAFQRLKENWSLNKWPTENLHQIAIGESEGTGFIDDTAGPRTTNSVQLTASSQNVPVKVRALDSFLDTWRALGQIGLLKVDVEGFEESVFRGAVNLFRLHAPQLVMFESLSGSLDPGIEEVFQEADYAVFQLGPKGECELGRTDAQNLFAAPRANVSLICAPN